MTALHLARFSALRWRARSRTARSLMAMIAVSSRKVLRVFESAVSILTASSTIEAGSKQATLCTMKVFTSSQNFAFAISLSGSGQVDSSPESEISGSAAPLMNNTKWDELRVAMEALDRQPLWALQGRQQPLFRR